jgi:hypothetical protein
MAMPFVLKVLSFVNVATCPFENSVSLLQVIGIFTIVCVAILTIFIRSPFTFTMLHAVFKFTNVYLPCGPSKCAFTMMLSLNINACVSITSSKRISSISMLQAIVPATFILITVWKYMQPKSMSFRLVPLS